MSIHVRLNWIIASLENLTTRINKLQSDFMSSSHVPITSTSVHSSDGVLVFDGHNSQFQVWRVWLIESIRLFRFQNLVANGRYTIYINTGLPLVIAKASSINNLNGNLMCSPGSIFVITVFYDGVHPLVRWDNFTPVPLAPTLLQSEALALAEQQSEALALAEQQAQAQAQAFALAEQQAQSNAINF